MFNLYDRDYGFHLIIGLSGLSLVHIWKGRIVARGMTLTSIKVVEVELELLVELRLVEVLDVLIEVETDVELLVEEVEVETEVEELVEEVDVVV